MGSAELREWLGLCFADLLVYLGGAAIVAMFFLAPSPLKTALAVAALALLVAACPPGMRSNPEVSAAANAVKKFAYPLGVVVGLFLIGLSYARPYRIPQNGMYPTLSAGHRFLVLRRPYRDASEVARGDVVVFSQAVGGRTYDFIWRVVGLPGDTVVVNGRPPGGKSCAGRGSWSSSARTTARRPTRSPTGRRRPSVRRTRR